MSGSAAAIRFGATDNIGAQMRHNACPVLAHTCGAAADPASAVKRHAVACTLAIARIGDCASHAVIAGITRGSVDPNAAVLGAAAGGARVGASAVCVLRALAAADAGALA